MQNTRRLADAKAENDALRDDVAVVVVGLSSSLSISAAIPPPAWIMQPPPTTNTLNKLFTLRERPQSLCKNSLEGTQKYINEQCR